MADELIDLDLHRHAKDLRESWQARALAGTKGLLNAVILSVLAHSYDETMPVLLRIVYPGFTSISAPFFCSAGKIHHSGHIVADMVLEDGVIAKDIRVFDGELHMRDVFRILADLMKLKDEDRIQMFIAAHNWIVADRRLDPAFDPKDPDARRIVHH